MQMLRRLAALTCLLMLASTAYAQSGSTVRGTVTDADTGDPLPGVSILVKGTAQGTITGIDGDYTLNVPAGSDSLQFSYIGYVTQTIAVAGRSVIDVTMQSEALQGDEVVVVGYGTQRREALTGSVATVTADDLARSSATTTSGALAGKVPGVLVRQPEGRPGASAMLQVRNMGTPLYVIDGIPKDEGQFNNIDFNDIESISILKDASAASIYGVRAANGVVLVTTKKGRQNQENTVEVKSYLGFQSWNRFPRAADAATFVRALAEADMNQSGQTNWTEEELAKWKAGTEKGYRGFDWYDFAVRSNVPKQYLQISTTGGSDKANYYVSLGRVNDEGVFEGYGFDRTNIQANVDTKIGGRLTVGAQVNGRIERRANPGNPGVDDYWQPIFGLYRNLPTERPYANDNPNYPAATSNGASNYATLNYDVSGWHENTWRVAQLNVNAGYNFPVKGLTGKAIFGYYLADNVEETFEYTYELYTYDEATDTYVVTGGNQNPYRDRRLQKVEENILQLQLNYDNRFGAHEVGLDAAFEANERSTPSFWFRSQPSTNYIDLVNFNELAELSDSRWEEARMGFAVRANYGYDDRYLLEVAGRYDASWQFAPGKRWGLFPSVSAGWRISEESFYKHSSLSDVLTNLKLRASVGQLGDDRVGIGPFDYLEGYNFRRGSYVFDGTLVTGIEPRGLPVTNISWTRSTMTNVGLDFGLWNNTLSGTIEGFYRKRTGLPARKWDVLIPEEVAIYLPNENLNADVHTGVEGSLTYANVIGDGIQLSVGGNFTFARQRDLYTYKPRFGNSWDEYRTSIEDRWAFLNWGYQVIGQFKSQEEIDNYPVDIDGRNNTTLLPGDFIYKDVNGDGIITSLDERPIGYRQGALPYLNFGFNTYTAYKGFDLALNFAGAAFASYTRNWEMRIPFQNNANSPAYMFEDRWHRKDIFDPNSEWVPGTYPALRKGLAGHSNMRHNDFWTENVHYLRLENVELGYTLPKTLIDRFSIDRMRIYASAANLFSLDNMKKYGIDPEVASDNGLQYPQTRMVSLGVTLGF